VIVKLRHGPANIEIRHPTSTSASGTRRLFSASDLAPA
jgi:hypothetical protein